MVFALEPKTSHQDRNLTMKPTYHTSRAIFIAQKHTSYWMLHQPQCLDYTEVTHSYSAI